MVERSKLIKKAYNFADSVGLPGEGGGMLYIAVYGFPNMLALIGVDDQFTYYTGT
jgi:hypothetical protein